MFKYQKLFKILLIVFVLFTLYFILKGIRQKDQSNLIKGFKADGVGMIHVRFNKKNKKSIEFKCIESKIEHNNKIAMKKVDGTIFKKGRMNKDLKIIADKGLFENDFYNFFIEKNAKLISDNFIIKSDSFFLKDRLIFSTDKIVHFKVENLNGYARKGMKFNIKLNILKLFDTEGTLKKSNKIFKYKTAELIFVEKNKALILQRESKIESKDSLLKSNRIAMKFTDDLKKVKFSVASGNCHLILGDKKKSNDYKEIRSEDIRSFIDLEAKEANIKKLVISKKGSVQIKTESNLTKMESDLIGIYFEKDTGKIESIKMLSYGRVKNRGKTNFFISSNKMELNFDNGEIKLCKAKGRCDFKIDEYKGKSDILTYDIDKQKIKIKGKNSVIRIKNNRFNSNRFIVEIKKKRLSSSNGIKSIVKLNKENVLFSSKSIFINSKRMVYQSKEENFQYEGNIHLEQENTVLNSEKLGINKKNDVIASGNVFLSFKNKDNEVILKGEKINFDSKKKIIVIDIKGEIKNGKNILKAEKLFIKFNENSEINSVNGEDKVNFNKEDIYGSSKKVIWLFKKDFIIFKDSAQLQRENGAITKAKELRFDLKKNKIITVSDKIKRTETILK